MKAVTFIAIMNPSGRWVMASLGLVIIMSVLVSQHSSVVAEDDMSLDPNEEELDFDEYDEEYGDDDEEEEDEEEADEKNPVTDWMERLPTPHPWVPTVDPREMRALSELFAATRGLRWHVNAGWGCGDPCSSMGWGVHCAWDWHTGRPTVVELNLPSHGLVGTLPSSMGDLSRLHQLNLRGNVLHGALPAWAAWGHMKAREGQAREASHGERRKGIML